MKDKKILKDEILSDEALDKIAGGNDDSLEVLPTPKRDPSKNPFYPGEVEDPKLPPELL